MIAYLFFYAIIQKAKELIEMFTQYYQKPLFLKGRIVSNIEEVKAIPIEFDGTSTYFPCPAEKSIYVKSIDNNGIPTIQAYKYVKEEPPSITKYATLEEVEKLDQKLKAIENYLGKASAENEHTRDIPNNSEFTEHEQSIGNSANEVRTKPFLPTSVRNEQG